MVAKAALGTDRPRFRALHERLLSAYFGENRDISSEGELRALWGEAGLDPAGFPALDDPALVGAVVDDHSDLVARGGTGVPAVMMVGNDAVVVGAQPLATYRRWVERSLERVLRTAGGEGEH